MNTSLAKEWLLRIFGYGVSALAGWIGTKWGPEVGGAAAVIGTAATNKAIPYIIPTRSNVQAAQMMPAPAKYVPKPLQK